MGPDFDWDDLRYFLAVARAGSLAGAARTLRVNHSTVYRRIGALEESVAARLFERQPRGYALTGVGEEMFLIAGRIEDDMLALSRAVTGRDAELHGRVRLTSVDELIALLTPRLIGFHRAYPGIELEVGGETRHVSLGRREADVALRPGVRPSEPEVVGRRLCSVAAALFASSAYLEANGVPSDPERLDGHALIALSASLEHIPLHTALVARAAEPRIAFRASNMTGVKAAAEAGFGVAMLPCFMGDPSPDLVRIGAPRMDDETGLWLLVHADLRQTARVRAFVDYLAEAVLADVELFEGRKG